MSYVSTHQMDYRFNSSNLTKGIIMTSLETKNTELVCSISRSEAFLIQCALEMVMDANGGVPVVPESALTGEDVDSNKLLMQNFASLHDKLTESTSDKS